MQLSRRWRPSTPPLRGWLILSAAERSAPLCRVPRPRADLLRDQQEARPGGAGVDPLREQADACLDGLAEVARMEARLAALKVQLTAGYANAEKAMASPAESPQDRTVREMAVTSEIACVLTVSERAASALLVDALELTIVLPLTLAALQAGALSWQHARIMVDETAEPRPGRGGSAGGALPGPGRAGPGPRHARPGSLSRAGSGPRRVPGGNATTRSASKNATPTVRGPAGGVRPGPGRDGLALSLSARRYRRPGSGTAPPPPPGPCRAPTRPGPSPSSAPTSPPPGSSNQPRNHTSRHL